MKDAFYLANLVVSLGGVCAPVPIDFLLVDVCLVEAARRSDSLLTVWFLQVK